MPPKPIKPSSTPDDFRELALACEGAVEGAHMGHADFRVFDRVFASLGYPDPAWGMIKLTKDEQALRLATVPGAFKPAAGAWGRHGSTMVKLDMVDSKTLESAIAAAWVYVAAKKGKRMRKTVAKKKAIDRKKAFG
ncbi:hypothetical protein [Roseiterribacter gracilis]|uniref:Uncharacterized protein n=1 Tax=Roseiterribacter gracilis TaxID=2812848 RepID=A0A8S8XCL1_9PROT|nr:hypothetical protein TMPK1_20490 [Rhodospirillales bacterium TMPK1]